MARSQRWMRLDTGIFDSEWVYLLSPMAQLAWIRLLLHVKTEGVKGTAKALSVPVASKKWGISSEEIQAMLDAATEDGALLCGDEWGVTNWLKYQESPSTERVRKHRALQSDDVTPESVTARYPCRVTETETETELFTEVNNGSGSGKPSEDAPMPEPYGTVYRVLLACEDREPPESKVKRYLGKDSPIRGLVKQYGEADAIRLIKWAAKHKRVGVAVVYGNSGVWWQEANDCNWGAPPERGKKPGWGDPAEDIRKMTEDLLRG